VVSLSASNWSEDGSAHTGSADKGKPKALISFLGLYYELGAAATAAQVIAEFDESGHTAKRKVL
jgi:hypothetical protein